MPKPLCHQQKQHFIQKKVHGTRMAQHVGIYIFQNFWLTYKGFFSITCYKIAYRHCCYLPVPVNIKKRIVGISRWKELPSVLLKMAAYLLYARNMPRSGTLNCYNDIRDCFLPSAYLQVFNQVFNALLCPYHKLG